MGLNRLNTNNNIGSDGGFSTINLNLNLGFAWRLERFVLTGFLKEHRKTGN